MTFCDHVFNYIVFRPMSLNLSPWLPEVMEAEGQEQVSLTIYLSIYLVMEAGGQEFDLVFIYKS